MSMNVYIYAEREVTAKLKNGDEVVSTQKEKWNALQTPTVDTYEIVNSRDPKQAYVDWCFSKSNPESIPIYAEDDIFNERDPIGWEEYDFYVDHIAQFEEWFYNMDQQGYTVKFEVI